MEHISRSWIRTINILKLARYWSIDLRFDANWSIDSMRSPSETQPVSLCKSTIRSEFMWTFKEADCPEPFWEWRIHLEGSHFIISTLATSYSSADSVVSAQVRAGGELSPLCSLILGKTIRWGGRIVFSTNGRTGRTEYPPAKEWNQTSNSHLLTTKRNWKWIKDLTEALTR